MAVGVLAGIILALPVILLAPQRGGPIGMLRIFYPQSGLLLLGCLPFAWRLRWLFLGALLALVVACPPALGRSGQEPGFTVGTWNAGLWGNVLPDADILALQEVDTDLVPEERFAHVWTQPPGMALLSKFPMTDRKTLEGEVWDIPRVMWARVDRLDLTVVNIHPIPPYTYDGGLRLEPELRDRQIEDLRLKVIDPMLEKGERFLVLGDCNVCEREPGYRRLAEGLQDGFRVAGFGYQTTWAPGRLPGWGLGLLRLDYQLASPGVIPLESKALPSSQGSDHFPVLGRYRDEGKPPSARRHPGER